MKSKEFLNSLADIAESLRANIEANCTGWDDSPQAVAERVAKVKDEFDGFEYFVNEYFPHYIRHESKSQLHEYLFKRLPDMLRQPTSQKEVIAAPRGEAKSTLVTQMYTLYRIITQRTRFAFIIMDSDDQAYTMLEAVKAELEFNPRIKMDFPEVAGQGRVWQAGTIITATNIKVKAAGSGKKIRGSRHGAYRPDFVVLDDIENDENVQKPEQRDKTQSWLNKTVMKLGAAGEKIDFVYIGTMLHYDSVLKRTMDKPDWNAKLFKAILVWPQNMTLWDEWTMLYRSERTEEAARFYKAHEQAMNEGAVVSWQARPLIVLMKERANDGASFDSEYQNDPAAGEDAVFNGSINYWHELPQGLIYFGSIDPSMGKRGKSRDPSAIIVGGYDRRTGVLYVIEADIRRRVPDKIISDVIRYQAKYGCIVWVCEAIAFQEFLRTELVKRSAEAHIHVPVRPVVPNTDKLLRIESLQPHMFNELLLIHQDQQTLDDQFKHFPKADHDDGPDAVEMCWKVATGFMQTAPTQAFHVPEPSFYP